MAWNTGSVIAGEIMHEAEAQQNMLGHDWDYSDAADDLYTGDGGLDGVGPFAGVGWGDLPGTSWTTFRCGYWLKCKGWWSHSSDLVFIAAYGRADDNTEKMYFVKWEEDTFTIDLVEYDINGVATILDSTNDVTPLFGNMEEWKHVAFYFNNSTNSIKFWVNGVELLSGTPSEGKPFFVYVHHSSFLADPGGYASIDDVYFDWSTSSEVDDVPPARRYYPALPDYAGTHNDWTPNGAALNYQCVDDPGVPDDETTYVSSSVVGDKDTYNVNTVAGLLHPAAQPDSAIIQAYAKSYPGGLSTSQINFLCRQGASEDQTGPHTIRQQKTLGPYFGSTTYIDWIVLTGFFDVQPSGAGEWTVVGFVTTEFGYETERL